MSIQEFIEAVLKINQPEVQKFIIGKLTEEEIRNIHTITGIDLSDYTRIVDNFGVKHAFNKHGNQKREEKHGQVAIDIADFNRITDIVSNFDTLETGEKDRIGNDLIKYIKQYENQMVYVEEIRTGRKELAMKTMYKKKKDAEQRTDD